MLPMYNTKLFNEIYDDAGTFQYYYNDFQNDFGDINKIDDTYVRLTWQLLSAKYGNDPIANLSEDQFKLKVWQIMFQYGPTWVKRLEMQQSLRDTDIADFREGQKFITNTALGPDQEPSTEEITYVNQQNVSKSTTGLLNTYASLWELLRVDVNSEYLDKFKDLFLKVVIPRTNIYYESDEEEI